MDSDLGKKRALIEKAVMSAALHLSNACGKRDKITFESKPDHTIVMNLDLECQQRILEVLGDVPVLAEENEESHSLIGTEESYFVVDPIDGTASCRRYLGTSGGQIGFGPLAGYAEGGKLRVAVYYNLPTSTLYSAAYNEGAYACELSPDGPISNAKRIKLSHQKAVPLNQSAILFYPGSLEELKTIMYLRTNGLVENTYRLGGFANDTTRVAAGLEQIQLQTRVKAWDFPSVLIAREAGLQGIMDPFKARVSFEDWVIKADNPVLVAHPEVMPKLLNSIALSLEN